MRKLISGVVIAMLASSSVASAVAPGFAAGTTTRVSVSSTGTPASATLQSQVLSQDGRYVVFASTATNLVGLATFGRLEVYRHDRVTGVTELVSLSRTGVASTGNSFAPTVSADGRFVAFMSFGSDLVAGDTNTAPDVFVRDMTNGTTVAASTDANGAFVSGGGSLANFPGARAISDDGRYVVFASSSALLVSASNNGVAQVYVKDLSTGAVVRASVDAFGNGGNALSGQATISGDGSVVAFQSTSTNLSATATGGLSEIFSRDLTAGTTALESVSTAGAAADLGAAYPGLSRDGRYLVFETQSQLDTTDVDYAYDVYLRDRASGTTTLASPGAGTGNSRSPSISADGAYVAFSSEDTLVTGDTNNVSDVFLWNRVTSAYTLVSLNDAGEQANAASTFPSVSANAGSVLFASTASNLVSSPLTTTTQLYVREVASDQAPVVAPLVDASVGEGVTFTTAGSFSDPDGSTAWTATVDWGDGSAVAPLALAPDKTFSLSRLLAPGAYAVTVSVTDGEGLTGTSAFHVSVANLAPSVSAGSDTVVGFGATFTGGGAFTDPGTTEQYSATVDYGDGTGVVPLALAADRTFSLSHTYAGIGTYAVTVAVNDSNGGTGTGSFGVDVRDDTFSWLSPTPTTANAGRTLPVRFTVGAADGSFVRDESARVELLDGSGNAVNGPYVWSSTPSTGVTLSDGVYAVNVDTSKDAAGQYTLRVSFSSSVLSGSFSRTLTLTPSNASPQRAVR